MHLLQMYDADSVRLVELLGNDVPKYAILSHTWGQSNDEVTYQDLQNHTAEGKEGYNKLMFCGKQALRDGLQYFWVDTCCIDKQSSAELSEAINSMFQWYKRASKCYVYLSDVRLENHSSIDNCSDNQDQWKSTLR